VRRIVLGLVSAALCLGGVGLAPAVSAAEVDVMTDCHGPITVYATVGDTIVFTLTPQCSGAGELWDVGPAFPEPLGSGFLSLEGVSDGGSYVLHSWFSDDWNVFSSDQSPTIVRTTLQSLGINSGGGANTPLAPGAVIANVSPDDEVFYPVTYEPTSDAPRPTIMWNQAIGRASASAACPAGYTPSWDTWPNNHTGGYVCNRFVPMYGG